MRKSRESQPGRGQHRQSAGSAAGLVLGRGGWDLSGRPWDSPTGQVHSSFPSGNNSHNCNAETQSGWMACMAHPPRNLGNHWVYFFPEFVYF